MGPTGRVVYASQSGAPMADGFRAGPDATEALQAILDTAGPASPLELVLDGTFAVRGLRVRSCTTLRGLGAGGGLFLLPGAGTYAITNAHHTSSYVGPMAAPDFSGRMIVDHDIVIRDLAVDVNRRGGLSGHPTVGHVNTTGRMIHGICLWGVRRARIDGVRVYDPPAYGISVANCFGGVFTNIEVICPEIANYQAAVQVQGPSCDLYLANLRGTTGDDFLAFNAADGNLSQKISIEYPSGPQAYGDFTEVYYGPIRRVVARGIYPDRCGSALRLLSGRDHRPGAVGPLALIDQVSVSDVVGSVYWHAFLANTFDDLGPGEYGRIILADWQVDMLAPGDKPASYTQHNDGYAVIGGSHQSLILSNHNRGTMAAAQNSIRISADAVIGECRISGMAINETGAAAGSDAVHVERGANVRLMRLLDSSWRRSGSAAHALVRVDAGARVDDLQVRDAHLDGVADAVTADDSAVGHLAITGLVHR